MEKSRDGGGDWKTVEDGACHWCMKNNTTNIEHKGYSSREARIRLTPKCNYRCYFCHEEGGCQAPAAIWESLRALLLALKTQGRREITFTGGEPLLNKPVLLKALAEIASWDAQPVVTLITNAVLLDESVIAALEKCRSAKVHVSIHDPRTPQYQLVTGQSRRSADELRPILRRLSSGPVHLKLNAVVTDGLAGEGGGFDAILDYARDVGAGTVKFVELFETKDAAGWPQKAVPVAELDARFAAEGFVLFRRTLRTSYWRTPSGLVLETTRCACALGCEHCEATHGDFFTGGTHFHPCFLAEKAIAMEGRTLEEVLAEGDAYLQKVIRARKAA